MDIRGTMHQQGMRTYFIVLTAAFVILWIINSPVAVFMVALLTPIEFYGRVVDQNGDAVVGASIKVYPFEYGSDESRKYFLTSDKEGRFAVTGLRGINLGVQVEKEGYLTITDMAPQKPASSRRIEYGLTDDKGARYKDPLNPTLLTLHKIGPVESLFYIEQQRWNLPVNGVRHKLALDSKDGIGGHQIEFCYSSDWSKLPNDNEINSKRFNWKFEASIPGGGFFKCDSAYHFEAPESGYQKNILFDYPATLPEGEWKILTHGRYFVKFPDGTYGRIAFSIFGNSDSSPLLMTSWLSLKPKSRNLASAERDYTIYPND